MEDQMTPFLKTTRSTWTFSLLLLAAIGCSQKSSPAGNQDHALVATTQQEAPAPAYTGFLQAPDAQTWQELIAATEQQPAGDWAVQTLNFVNANDWRIQRDLPNSMSRTDEAEADEPSEFSLAMQEWSECVDEASAEHDAYTATYDASGGNPPGRFDPEAVCGERPINPAITTRETPVGPPEGTPDGLPFVIHHYNLTQSGIHQIQNMKLDELARDRVWTSCTIILPLRSAGNSGSPVRPVAIGVSH